MSAPALTALTDQIHTAEREAHNLLVRIAGQPGGQLAGHHPGGSGGRWVTDRLNALRREVLAGQVGACPHVLRAPQIVFAAVWAPGRIVCASCIRSLDPSPAEDQVCDRCRTVHPTLYVTWAGLGPLLLGFGLCRSCSQAVGTYRHPSTAAPAPARTSRPGNTPPAPHPKPRTKRRRR